MMHAFGDSSQPMPESAQLIESIVQEQLDALIDKASEVAQLRESPTIGPEDILFLLRKDKSKLVRLINHLYVKDIKASFNNDGNSQADIKVFDMSRSQTRRVKICYDYLSQLDEFGEYKKVFNQALFDEIKNQRMRRMDSFTRNMSYQEYSDFTKARQVSFISKIKSERFREWLLASKPEAKISLFAFEMIQYLAHETVAQVVDLALLVKQDSERDPYDPLSVLITRSSHNRQSDKAPTTAGSLNSCPSQQQAKTFNSTPYCMTEPSHHPRCITPSHIHEAMRRYCVQKGPFVEYQMRNGGSPLSILCV